jgi:hypothetical protein
MAKIKVKIKDKNGDKDDKPKLGFMVPTGKKKPKEK